MRTEIAHIRRLSRDITQRLEDSDRRCINPSASDASCVGGDAEVHHGAGNAVVTIEAGVRTILRRRGAHRDGAAEFSGYQRAHDGEPQPRRLRDLELVIDADTVVNHS